MVSKGKQTFGTHVIEILRPNDSQILLLLAFRFAGLRRSRLLGWLFRAPSTGVWVLPTLHTSRALVLLGDKTELSGVEPLTDTPVHSDRRFTTAMMVRSNSS